MLEAGLDAGEGVLEGKRDGEGDGSGKVVRPSFRPPEEVLLSKSIKDETVLDEAPSSLAEDVLCPSGREARTCFLASAAKAAIIAASRAAGWR